MSSNSPVFALKRNSSTVRYCFEADAEPGVLPRALELLANPERLLSVTQVGVTLASLGLGWAGEETLYELFLGWMGAITPLQSNVLHGASFTQDVRSEEHTSELQSH